jgi:glycosyltransferase involved in cell wall biosynthesis
MNIAALLPNVEVYGGVRRYLELGNALVRRGHEYTLFTPAGEKPDWLEFRGRSMPFEALSGMEFDVGICGEYSILPQFDRLRAGAKFFYFVLEGHKLEKAVARRSYRFLGSSEGICRRIERKYGVTCPRAPGGINPDVFHPVPRGALHAGDGAAVSPGSDQEESASLSGVSRNDHPDILTPFTILSYGRIYKKRKGVHHVIRAAEVLHRKYPGVRLIFFDSLVGRDRRDPRPLIKTSVPYEFHLDLPQDRLARLFSRADAFVSAERRAGWANTAAEAMACRLPVVCTASGSRDFAVDGITALVVPFAHPYFLKRQVERLILDPALRERLAAAGRDKIMTFTWDSLAARLEGLFAAARPN